MDSNGLLHFLSWQLIESNKSSLLFKKDIKLGIVVPLARNFKILEKRIIFMQIFQTKNCKEYVFDSTSKMKRTKQIWNT